MNTGIADAVNLAWKLAAVLQGRAAGALAFRSVNDPVGQIDAGETRGGLQSPRLNLLEQAPGSG